MEERAIDATNERQCPQHGRMAFVSYARLTGTGGSRRTTVYRCVACGWMSIVVDDGGGVSVRSGYPDDGGVPRESQPGAAGEPDGTDPGDIWQDVYSEGAAGGGDDATS